MKCTQCKENVKEEDICYINCKIICQRCFRKYGVQKRSNKMIEKMNRTAKGFCKECGKYLCNSNRSGYCNEHWTKYMKRVSYAR